MNTSVNFEGHNEDSPATKVLASIQPVMLALDTFKHSNKAIETALEKAKQCKKLVIVYAADVNLNGYFIASGVGLYPEWKKQCEQELLRQIEQKCKKKIEIVAQKATAQGLHVVTYVRAGHFMSLCSEISEKENPFLIITTRSHRSSWSRLLCHRPIDRLVAYAKCPVIEV